MLTSGGERPTLQASDTDEIGAHRNSLYYVCAAAKRTVDHDLGTPGDGFDNLGQDMHRASAMIELTPAVV